MAITNERTKEINRLTGSRLKECLKLNRMKQSKLIDKVESKYGIVIKKSFMSQMCNGTSSINDDYKRMFAAILNIDAGYLFGTDNFIADNYDEYVDNSELIKNDSIIDRTLPQLEKYLKPNGYEIYSFGSENNIEESTFTLVRGKNIEDKIRLTYEELVQFNLDVDEYVSLAAEKLFKQHKFD